MAAILIFQLLVTSFFPWSPYFYVFKMMCSSFSAELNDSLLHRLRHVMPSALVLFYIQVPLHTYFHPDPIHSKLEISVTITCIQFKTAFASEKCTGHMQVAWHCFGCQLQKALLQGTCKQMCHVIEKQSFLEITFAVAQHLNQQEFILKNASYAQPFLIILKLQ